MCTLTWMLLSIIDTVNYTAKKIDLLLSSINYCIHCKLAREYLGHNYWPVKDQNYVKMQGCQNIL